MRQLSSLQKKIFSGPIPQQDGSEIFFVPRPRIALVASIAWTLWNYRLSLIKALEAAGYEVWLFAAEDASCEKLSQHTHARFVPLHHLSRQSLSLRENIKCLWELFVALRRYRPDVALLFTIRPNTLGNFAAAAAGIPALSTIEGLGAAGNRQNWLGRVTRTLYRLAFRFPHTVVFLNTDDMQEFVTHNIVSKQKTRLVPGPGIDLKYFAPMQTGPSAGKTVFLFSGRLLSEKGVREYVAAARILQKRGVAAEYRILGRTDPGNPATISEMELKAWMQEGVVTCLGFHDDVRPALAAADVLVLPSYYREGIPRSVLEAMGMEKPIVTTQTIGCRETVEEGKNGFLVPPRDVSALVTALEKMCALSPAQRAEMGKYSRRKALAEFGDDRVLPFYLDWIGEVLEKHKK